MHAHTFSLLAATISLMSLQSFRANETGKPARARRAASSGSAATSSLAAPSRRAASPGEMTRYLVWQLESRKSGLSEVESHEALCNPGNASFVSQTDASFLDGGLAPWDVAQKLPASGDFPSFHDTGTKHPEARFSRFEPKMCQRLGK